MKGTETLNERRKKEERHCGQQGDNIVSKLSNNENAFLCHTAVVTFEKDQYSPIFYVLMALVSIITALSLNEICQIQERNKNQANAR